jgi:hypothetical protein
MLEQTRQVEVLTAFQRLERQIVTDKSNLLKIVTVMVYSKDSGKRFAGFFQGCHFAIIVFFSDSKDSGETQKDSTAKQLCWKKRSFHRR